MDMMAKLIKPSNGYYLSSHAFGLLSTEFNFAYSQCFAPRGQGDSTRPGSLLHLQLLHLLAGPFIRSFSLGSLKVFGHLWSPLSCFYHLSKSALDSLMSVVHFQH